MPTNTNNPCVGQIGPITPRRLLVIQLFFVGYFAALFGGFLSFLPNLPFMGGNPFEKFNLGPENWALAYQASGIIIYLGFITAAVVFAGTDYDCVVACKAYTINWFVCGCVFGYQVLFSSLNFTESNILAFALVFPFAYLGFFSNAEYKKPSETGSTLVALGPITSRIMLYIQLVLCFYFGALFAGYLSWMPNLPMMGGDPFDKFGFAPVNWTLMTQTVGIIFYLGNLTGFLAFLSTDGMAVSTCAAFCVTWALCGLIWGVEVATMDVTFTEVNILPFLLSAIFGYLGFGPKTVKGATMM